MTIPLAQLVDLLPDLNWNLVIPIGLLAPAIGFLISMRFYGFRQGKATLAGLFYALALPLTGLTLIAHTENPLCVCSFLVLLPVGMLLGIIMLFPI